MDHIKQICVALDVDSIDIAVSLSEKLKNYVGLFKIGLQLYSSAGPLVVKKIKKAGGDVFLDLKFHDIPNTVANATRVITRLGVSMLNVHATGGYEMIARAVDAARNEAERAKVNTPKILAVTLLTSINQHILETEIKVESPLLDHVIHLARIAQRAGADGVVASPQETKVLREELGAGFLILTPGIRPTWSLSPDDQKRVTTPADAIQSGSDYIVIGRPITAANDPREAVKKIIAEIQSRQVL